MDGHPPLDLHTHPESGLSFKWADRINSTGLESVFKASFGPEGAGAGMEMYIEWDDLEQALMELVGYSWQDTLSNPSKSTLRRVLPWQNMYWNQLYVQRVFSVEGLQFVGTDSLGQFAPDGGRIGAGYNPNLGPWSKYNYAKLVLQFWRPPYNVLTDTAVIVGGKAQEWLRYTDKHWEPDTQVLSREGQVFQYSKSQGTPTGRPFPGSVGQKIQRFGVKRKWYQLPEAAVYQITPDMQPNGLPVHLAYTQTQTTNPITGLVYVVGSPIGGCVNSPIGGGVDDSDGSKQFFGAPMGTLLYKGLRLSPAPLQLPPALMQIPYLANNEALAQVQVDVEMMFDVFDPVRSPAVATSSTVVPWALLADPAATHPTVKEAYRGHNLMPWSGDGRWYAVNSQVNVDGVAFPSTPFDYADLSDLFQIV